MERPSESHEKCSYIDILAKLDLITENDIATFKKSLSPEIWDLFDDFSPEEKLKLTGLSKLTDEEINYLIETNQVNSLGFHNLNNLLCVLSLLKSKL